MMHGLESAGRVRAVLFPSLRLLCRSVHVAVSGNVEAASEPRGVGAGLVY
jgi:hypothetical protein